MKTPQILLVDDDPSIRKFVRANLEARGYAVIIAGDGKEALKIIEKELPDLIILDIMMPAVDGLEVCRRVRGWSNIPIIMLSARDAETDKINCLDCGADDYLTKPFSLKELISRVKAVLRRTDRSNDSTDKSKFQNNGLVVDFDRHIVTLHGKIINLTSIEDKILQYLSQNAGRIVTINQLLERIWGEGYCGDSCLLQVNICRLRRKLKDSAKDHKYILTKPGIGYMVVKPD